MPTQSLILRGNINRRLTVAEMDGNFTYLESLAQEGGGGTTSAPQNHIPVGTGTGLTSSDNFTYDYINNNLISSIDNVISSTNSCQSSIIGEHSDIIFIFVICILKEWLRQSDLL